MKKHVVIVVCDSLRRDLVTPALAPHLSALRAASRDYALARGVFPSTTRTSAASMATGCLPQEHGLLGNTMVIDEGNGLVCLSVGKPDFLQRLRSATGHALRRPTLAEILAPHGGVVVMSNVSPGAAYVQDPEHFGQVHHRSGSWGPGRVPLQPPLDIQIGSDGDAEMTRRFCDDVLRRQTPALGVLWLSEPDHAAHSQPQGSPQHKAAIASADECVQRVVQTVDALDPFGENFLLIACSDHGMETVRRQIDLTALLVEAGLKASTESGDVVVAPQGTSAVLYFSAQARQRIGAVDAWLQAQDFCGQTFTAAALADIGLPTGTTLGLALTLRCTNEANPFGVVGISDTVSSPFSSESRPGASQHGGLGTHEQQPFLYMRASSMAAATSLEPVSLIDIAPTVLKHLGVAAPAMQGRALN